MCVCVHLSSRACLSGVCTLLSTIAGESFMDFKIPAFEDFGDWKLATTLCDSTNQGPCSDYSLSQTTGEWI